jgi:tRNA G18 (ribose-2'-O)-methylase SpoU
MNNTKKTGKSFPLTIILDNIRSAYNVGSILRTADCAGVEEVWLCGYTPGIEHKKIKKTALDAEEFVPTRRFETLGQAITTFKNHHKEHNSQIFALETGENARNLWETDIPEIPTAVIFGNEVEGIQMNIITKHNVPVVEIPMFGKKDSLNVAVSVSVTCYEIIKRWSTK